MKNNKLMSTPLYAESWNVAWRRNYQGAILSDTKTTFNIIKNSFRYWAADPFVIEKDGKTYIFAELYDYIRCRGILGVCELKEAKCSKWVPIIVEPFHLSYPCIICKDDKVYLMPESGAGHTLMLYEAVEFPYKWKKVKVLRDNVIFADTTPLYHNKHNLAITHCVENPENPELTIIDIDNKNCDKVVEKYTAFLSRPAGNVFVYNNKNIRPAQYSSDCGDGYGKGLVFYQYDIDNDMNYTETQIKTIEPAELVFNKKIHLNGMHTYNSTETVEVIDVKTRRFNVIDLIFRLLHKIIR